MCGIWTVVSHNVDGIVPLPIPHRGPDDFGLTTFESSTKLQVQQATWRLSIVDLSPDGHMPMSYDDGMYSIAYNGEIYNHEELRRHLCGIGYRFRSSSDTEVILAAYTEWGEQCLSRLRGMFAFCLWDVSQERLFVARDRFGIKPLYFLNTPQGLACASEIKQFSALPWWNAKLNHSRTGEFLLYGFSNHTAETLFQDVRQLRGGETFSVSLKKWRPGEDLPIRSWYDLQAAPVFEGTLEHAIDRYRDLFLESVGMHLRADVPIGSCLSGGMDSSAIVGAVKRLRASSGVQEVFSSCSEQPQFDERRFADQVVQKHGLTANYLYPTAKEFFTDLDQLVWHQDEPFNSTSVYAQFRLFREARARRIPVILDGQGGDEQLQSYPQFFGLHFLQLLKQLRINQAFASARSFSEHQQWSYRNVAINLLARQTSSGWYRALSDSAGHIPVPNWFSRKAFADAGVNDPRPWPLLRRMAGQASGRELSRLMLTLTPLPTLLHWEDRSSMAHSIEARVPFLDHVLVEFTLSLPEEFTIRNGMTKYILRQATKDLVPPAILDRRDKMGFVTPEQQWFVQNEPEEACRRTLRVLDVFPTLFERERLRAYVHDVLSARLPFSPFICRLMTLAAWGDKFGVRA